MELYEICFSPTGGTRKVADMLAGGLADEIRFVDLTDSRADFAGVSLDAEDIAVIPLGTRPSPGNARIADLDFRTGIPLLQPAFHIPDISIVRISPHHRNGAAEKNDLHFLSRFQLRRQIPHSVTH